ncbi:hypothetical protein MMC29_005856, partial [Sticta canariensis]|nr:hypothetical protein [Sticta canariensis]
MPDYNKLTVVKLREELVNRGLPKTGLKPVLVSRLIESDQQIQSENETSDAQPVEQPASQAEQATLNAPPPLVQAQDLGGIAGGANGVDSRGLPGPEPETRSIIDAVLEEKSPLPNLESSEAVQKKDVILSAPEESSQDQPSLHALSAEPPPDMSENDLSLNKSLDKQPSSGGADLVGEILEKDSVDEPATQPSAPTNQSVLPDPVQVSLSATEILEDSRKRKRRSQSPPPLAIESAQKRAKTEGSRPDVKLPEDMDTEELKNARARVADDISMTDLAPVRFQETTQIANDTLIGVESLPAATNFEESTDQVGIPESVPPDDHMSEDLKNSQHDNVNLPEQPQSEQLPPDTQKTPAPPPNEQSPPPATEKTLAPPSSGEPKNDNEKISTLPSSEELENDREKTPALPLSGELQPETERTPTPSPTEGPHPGIEKTAAQLPNGESPGKLSPSDTRFRNLFAGPSKHEGSPTLQPSYADQEGRVVNAALHPATCALYIRDFMRPLHPDNLKDYLITLATPSGSTPNPQIITEFLLDPIRTHCLVGFDNTSAASRVRSSLHNRVWPNERSRRPLWADFVPEEKLKRWIEVELETSSSRGQAGKRWEVVYEEEKDGIKAYFQEAGTSSMAPRPSQPHPRSEEAGLGVRGAPSGPRSREVEPRPSQSGGALKPDNGKGFQALDDLFQSTDAKPKLYYLPVDKSTVNKRLDALDAGRGGGRGDEMRRYTFEDDTIVDRGPEFGA